MKNFEIFIDCGYRKGEFTCKNPRMLTRCPVGTHDLLKGVLNIKAYSFFFYLRDVCQGDLIGHIDGIIRGELGAPEDFKISRAKDALVSDFTRVFGVGEKRS